MRSLFVACGLAFLFLAGCGDDPPRETGASASSTTTVAQDQGDPAPPCEEYQGDALTDPCATLPDGPPQVPAACERASYEDAVRSEIDGGLRVGDAACDDQRLVLDFSVEACPPSEPGDPQREGCTRTKRAYFARAGARWRIVTYDRAVPCDSLSGDLAAFVALCEKLEAQRR